MKTRDFKIDTKELRKPYRDLMYVRFEGRRDNTKGKCVGSINTKAEARKLIKVLKEAKFYR